MTKLNSKKWKNVCLQRKKVFLGLAPSFYFKFNSFLDGFPFYPENNSKIKDLITWTRKKCKIFFLLIFHFSFTPTQVQMSRCPSRSWRKSSNFAKDLSPSCRKSIRVIRRFELLFRLAEHEKLFSSKRAEQYKAMVFSITAKHLNKIQCS